jgi:hypothetical protein
MELKGNIDLEEDLGRLTWAHILATYISRLEEVTSIPGPSRE